MREHTLVNGFILPTNSRLPRWHLLVCGNEAVGVWIGLKLNWKEMAICQCSTAWKTRISRFASISFASECDNKRTFNDQRLIYRCVRVHALYRVKLICQLKNGVQLNSVLLPPSDSVTVIAVVVLFHPSIISAMHHFTIISHVKRDIVTIWWPHV